MQVHFENPSKTVCQTDLFGCDENIKTGEISIVDIPGIDVPIKTQDYNNQSYFSAVLTGLGLRFSENDNFMSNVTDVSGSDDGSENAVGFEVVTQFYGENNLVDTHSFLSCFYKRKAMTMVEEFFTNNIFLYLESDVSGYSLVCSRIMRMGCGEDPIALAEHFVLTMLPFSRKARENSNFERNVKIRYERMKCKLAKSGDAESDFPMDAFVAEFKSKSNRSRKTKAEVSHTKHLKVLYRSYDPSLAAERFVCIDWTVIRSSNDVHALLSLIADIQTQIDIDDEESKIQLGVLVTAFTEVQKRCLTCLKAGADFDLSHLLPIEIAR